MFSFTGNTTNAFTSDRKNLPLVLENFSIVNKTAGAVSVSVYKVVNTSSLYCISPLGKTINASESYESDRQVVILASEQIRLETSGEVDYDFTMSNMTFK